MIVAPNPATVDQRKLATRNTKKVTKRMRRLGPRSCSCSAARGSLVSTKTIATNTMLASTPDSAECQPPATTYWNPADVLQVCGSEGADGMAISLVPGAFRRYDQRSVARDDRQFCSQPVAEARRRPEGFCRERAGGLRHPPPSRLFAQATGSVESALPRLPPSDWPSPATRHPRAATRGCPLLQRSEAAATGDLHELCRLPRTSHPTVSTSSVGLAWPIASIDSPRPPASSTITAIATAAVVRPISHRTRAERGATVPSASGSTTWPAPCTAPRSAIIAAPLTPTARGAVPGEPRRQTGSTMAPWRVGPAVLMGDTGRCPSRRCDHAPCAPSPSSTPNGTER